MAFKFSNSTSTNNTNRVNFDLVGNNAEVVKPRVISDNCIVFTLKCSGFSFYNMKVCCKKDNTMFVAPPSEKGKDGKYYPLYAIYLSDADQKAIIDKVLCIINGVTENVNPEDTPF